MATAQVMDSVLPDKDGWEVIDMKGIENPTEAEDGYADPQEGKNIGAVLGGSDRSENSNGTIMVRDSTDCVTTDWLGGQRTQMFSLVNVNTSEEENPQESSEQCIRNNNEGIPCISLECEYNTNSQVPADTPMVNKMEHLRMHLQTVHQMLCTQQTQAQWLVADSYLILIIPLAGIYLLYDPDPHHIGFFCDDQNLKHPYLPLTIPIVQCKLIWVAVSGLVIAVVGMLHSWVQAAGSNRSLWMRAAKPCRECCYFSLGALCVLLFTQQLTPELCEDEYGYKRFVTEHEESVCEGFNSGDVTKEQLQDARRASISEHASFSIYCGMFLIVFLQTRLGKLISHKTSQAFQFGSVGLESTTISTLQWRYLKEQLLAWGLQS